MKKAKKKEKSDYEELEDLFEKVEKIFEKEWGTRCPDFEPFCAQCSFWQDFNNFKRETFERSFPSSK
ncbi:MAG: hypothetical protein AABY22_16135 [Nanoarchaeota archaeon]